MIVLKISSASGSNHARHALLCHTKESLRGPKFMFETFFSIDVTWVSKHSVQNEVNSLLTLMVMVTTNRDPVMICQCSIRDKLVSLLNVLACSVGPII